MKKYKLKVYDYNAGYIEDDNDIELTTIKQLEDYLKSKGYKLGYIDFENKVLMVTKHRRFDQR